MSFKSENRKFEINDLILKRGQSEKSNFDGIGVKIDFKKNVIF